MCANWVDKAGLAVNPQKTKNICIAVLVVTVRWQRWMQERVIACRCSILFSAYTIWPQTKRRGKRDRVFLWTFYFFFSRLVEEELTFLALGAVSKQKAAMWWVWLAADGSEISGRAVRWMPSWPACDVQFVAWASVGRTALKIQLAVTQREMWFGSRDPSPKYLFGAICSFHSHMDVMHSVVAVNKKVCRLSSWW